MGFVHNIDPIFLEISGIYLWFYGLVYSIGFLGIFFWIKFRRKQLNFSLREVYELSVFFALGVLIFGRLFEVFFYEWEFYSKNPILIFAYWLGGMATHGVLLGALVSTFLFCKLRKKNFLKIIDELVIPGAFFMGIGRLGNFIDGRIVGSQTNVWWSVLFPDVGGFRHPVVLYDGLKNLLLIPALLWLKKIYPNKKGLAFASFVFLYGFLRFFVDLFREYETYIFGIGTGQNFNVFMSIAGLIMIFLFYKQKEKFKIKDPYTSLKKEDKDKIAIFILRIIFILLILFVLLIPSDLTRNIIQEYSERHLMDNASFIYKIFP